MSPHSESKNKKIQPRIYGLDDGLSSPSSDFPRAEGSLRPAARFLRLENTQALAVSISMEIEEMQNNNFKEISALREEIYDLTARFKRFVKDQPYSPRLPEVEEMVYQVAQRAPAPGGEQ